MSVSPRGIAGIGRSALSAWVVLRNRDAFAPGSQHAMQTEGRSFETAAGPAGDLDIQAHIVDLRARGNDGGNIELDQRPIAGAVLGRARDESFPSARTVQR